MTAPAGGGLVHDMSVALKRAALRRRLDAVASGSRDTLPVDLGDREVDLPGLIDSAAQRFGAMSPEFQRVAMGLKRTGAYDTAIDQLAAADPVRRARSARLAGALRMEQAVPWLGALLRATDAWTRDAAARALARIGGARSAECLLRAASRRPHSPTLLIGLAKASPDLFLDAAVSAPRSSLSREAAALAAGLRRSMASVAALRDMLASSPSGRERAAACRALGWIRAGAAGPALARALHDPDADVRRSAMKAMRSLAAAPGRAA